MWIWIEQFSSFGRLSIEILFRVVTVVCSMLASGWLHGLRKIVPSLEVRLPFFFFINMPVGQCVPVCVCVRVVRINVYSVGWTCTMYVFALLAKVVWPLLFWCNSRIDAQMNRSLQLSPEDSNTDSGIWVHAHLVDKQSEHHKGTIATILLPTQQTRPFKMSNEKAVARVQCSIDSKWAHHLTTMPNLWTPSILYTKC